MLCVVQFPTLFIKDDNRRLFYKSIAELTYIRNIICGLYNLDSYLDSTFQESTLHSLLFRITVIFISSSYIDLFPGDFFTHFKQYGIYLDSFIFIYSVIPFLGSDNHIKVKFQNQLSTKFCFYKWVVYIADISFLYIVIKPAMKLLLTRHFSLYNLALSWKGRTLLTIIPKLFSEIYYPPRRPVGDILESLNTFIPLRLL